MSMLSLHCIRFSMGQWYESGVMSNHSTEPYRPVKGRQPLSITSSRLLLYVVICKQIHLDRWSPVHFIVAGFFVRSDRERKKSARMR